MKSTAASKKDRRTKMRIRQMGISHIPISLRQLDDLAALRPGETHSFASLLRNRFAFIVAIVRLKRAEVLTKPTATY